MTQLTSDAASDSFISHEIHRHQISTGYVHICSKHPLKVFSLDLPYPHHPLVGRSTFVIERLLFASRSSTDILADIGYLSATLSPGDERCGF